MATIMRQIIGTTIICTICMNFGLMFAWPSSTIKLFSSTNTPLNRLMTETEILLFGSLSSITALISTPLSGYLLDILGRKYSCIIFSLPQVLAWALVLVCNRVESVLIAACISGFGGCFFTITPIYIAEICQENIRGTTTACSMIFYGIGMLLSYIFGGYLTYATTIYACLTLCIIGVLLMALLKESPTFLLTKGFNEEAAKAIAYYRGTEVESKEVIEEISVINKSLHPEFDDESPEEEKLKDGRKGHERLSVIGFIKKSKSTRRGFTVVIVLFFLSIFQGLVVTQVYAEPFFEEAVPNVAANMTSILFTIVNTIVGFITAYLTDVCGRRPLMIYSSLATGVTCVMLGSQIQFHWGPHWLTGVFLYAYCIFFTGGAGTVPYVVISEFFLPEIRSFLTMATVEWTWICNFVILFIFNPVVAIIGLGPVFYIFGVVSFLTAVYSFFYQPETKGLTVDMIQTLFLKKKH